MQGAVAMRPPSILTRCPSEGTKETEPTVRMMPASGRDADGATVMPPPLKRTEAAVWDALTVTSWIMRTSESSEGTSPPHVAGSSHGPACTVVTR